MAHESVDRPASPRHLIFIAIAVAATLPWLVLRFQGAHPSPPVTAALAGLAILGAAVMLSWAAEAFQKDVSQALALALLALIAVLPEYAVDMVFAWNAATDPTQAGYAVANMTGANRLLIGVGWSAIVFVAWLRFRAREVTMERSQSIEICILLIATLYAFTIPFRDAVAHLVPIPVGLSLVDTVIFVALFAVYAWAAAKAPSHEPDLEGPAELIGDLPTAKRRAATIGLFLFAAATIFLAAEPFAEGLVHTGTTFGIDEFLLVQWLAPLASEAPEFLVAILFAFRGDAAAGMRTMVSSKVNQWTLLVGTLPLVYSIALGRPGALPLDHRQVEELFLTSAQSLFAVVLILGLSLNLRGGIALFVLFIAQLFTTWEPARWAFAFGYVILAIGILAFDASRRAALIRLPREARASVSGDPSTEDLVHRASPSANPARNQ
jgi:cation:H+ antiporter